LIVTVLLCIESSYNLNRWRCLHNHHTTRLDCFAQGEDTDPKEHWDNLPWSRTIESN
jgi:hypothetical protein